MEPNPSNSIINKTTLQKIQHFKQIFQKMVIWFFVASVILGIIIILFAESSSDVLWRFIGSLMLLALAFLVSIDNFKKIEILQKSVQIMALIGLISNIIWLVLWFCVIWEVFNFSDSEVLGKITIISTYMSALGLFGSNALAINEYDRSNIIKPLKITAFVCLCYEMLFCTFEIIAEDLRLWNSRAAILAGFAGFVWFVSVCIAAIISNNIRKSKIKANTTNTPPANTTTKSDSELRAEIEEKVRREIIEKEVRAKLEAEQKQNDNQ